MKKTKLDAKTNSLSALLGLRPLYSDNKFKLRVLFFALYLQNQSHSFWSTKDDSFKYIRGGDKKQKGTNRVWSRPPTVIFIYFLFQ